MEERELRLMPEPETNILKTSLANNLVTLSTLLSEIRHLIDDMLSTKYDHTKESQNAKLLRELEITRQSRIYKALARRILGDIKPYLNHVDKEQYQDAVSILEKTQDFRLEEASSVFDYINQSAKNSNLTELGTKSILPEIIDVIDTNEIEKRIQETTPLPPPKDDSSRNYSGS